MYCENCGAAIPPRDQAGTCYSCEAPLYPLPPLNAQSQLLDDLEQQVVRLRGQQLGDEDDGDEDDPEDPVFAENRRDLFETHEEFAPVLPIFGDSAEADAAATRHPSSGSPVYMHFKVWTGKSWGYIWVLAATSTTAREAIFASEVKPHPLEGNSWGVGESFHRNRGKAVKRIGEKRPSLPGGVDHYLDSTGKTVRVRTQATES